LIMKEHDIDGGKSIDFDEFKQMMMGKWNQKKLY
jgi:hypothetical protein